jgi:hypothetical protein
MQLLSRGQKSFALVVNKRVDADSNSRYVSYRFQTMAAKSTTVEKKASEAEFNDSMPGDVVPIVYDPRDSSHCLAGYEIVSVGKDRIILVGWLLFSATLIFCMILYLRWQRHLRSSGIVLEGILTSVKTSKDDVESPSEADVLYTFRTPSSETIEANAKGQASRSNVSQFSLSELNRERGVTVAVLYLSNDNYELL